MDLDFGFGSIDKSENRHPFKIKQSECTFESKTLLKSQLQDRINAIFTQGGSYLQATNYSSMSPKEMEQLLGSEEKLKLLKEYLKVNNEMTDSQLESTIGSHIKHTKLMGQLNKQKTEAVENEDYALAE